MVAVTDSCATLPNLICRRLAHDTRLKVLPAPVDLGTFPVEMAWHVRYRHDPAHRWLRTLIGEVAGALVASEATGRRIEAPGSASKRIGLSPVAPT